jgi:hypothetical protein
VPTVADSVIPAVSEPARVSRPALTLTVVDCPAASVPDDGDTVR